MWRKKQNNNVSNMTDEWTIICKKFYFQYSSFRDVKNIQGNDGEILYFVILATSTILTF